MRRYSVSRKGASFVSAVIPDTSANLEVINNASPRSAAPQ